MDVQFSYAILYVEDVSKTIDFYQKVFSFRLKLITPENDYAELHTGNTIIAFANLELGNSNFKKGFNVSNKNKPPFGIELAFTTSRVSEIMERAIENGGTLIEDISKKPWGQDVGYVRDLNGFILEICTPITI